MRGLFDRPASQGYAPNRSGRLDIRSAAQLEPVQLEPALQPDSASLAILAEFGHDVDELELAVALLACTADAENPIISDPLTLEAALSSPERPHDWLAAIYSELDSHREAGTYSLKPCPEGVKPVGSMWVLGIKRDAAGVIIKYKARLVAKGYTQRYGVDYEETYAPVCRIGSIRVLLALTAHFDWEVHHMDVTTRLP